MQGLDMSQLERAVCTHLPFWETETQPTPFLDPPPHRQPFLDLAFLALWDLIGAHIVELRAMPRGSSQDPFQGLILLSCERLGC